MDFPIKSKYWKIIPNGDIDKTAQIIANTIGIGLMIGISKQSNSCLFLNCLHKKTKEEIELYKPLAESIYPCTKSTFLGTHELYDWYVTHNGLTSTGMDVITLSPF